MLATIHISRELRKKATIVLIAILIPIVYWPGGEYLEGVLSPKVYFLWIVVVIPAFIALLFAFNAYMNIQEDVRLEEGTTDSKTDQTTTAVSSRGER